MLFRSAKIIADQYADKKTVIFLPLVNTSKKMCALLNKYGVPAVEINGKSKDRTQKFQDYQDGKYQVLCNAMLATEGWDCPQVDCVVVLRPTKIRSFYQQMIGRGCRTYPGKENLLILDFLWLTQRHNLCRPSSLMAKDDYEFVYMQNHIRKSEAPLDLMQLQCDAVHAREKTLAERLKRMQARKSKLIDPLQFAMSSGFEDIMNYEPIFQWEKAAPSARQLETLERNGFDISMITNRGLASKIIDRLIMRTRKRLSSPKQIRCLENYGFEHVGQWKFTEANAMITLISHNHWNIPDNIEPETYTPRRGHFV